MAITDYTDYDSIRAILGVSDDEITDATLALPIYDVRLDELLYEFSPDMVVYYTAITPRPPTDMDTLRFYNVIRTFAAYQVAQLLLSALPVFSPQTMKDSKSEFSRIAAPFDKLSADIDGALNYLGGKLESAYSILVPSYIVADPLARVFVNSVSLGTDPVLGS